jgi:3-hydroxybutyryl-CoA dehydratase
VFNFSKGCFILNNYEFSQLRIGQEESFKVKITEKMIDDFISLTNDTSPIHTSKEYAASHGFRDRVCHGMLFGSMFSTLVGVYLPGEHCLLQSIDTKFLNVVYPGDTLTVSGKINELNDSFKLAFIKGEIKNQDGIKVCKAKIQIGVRE